MVPIPILPSEFGNIKFPLICKLFNGLVVPIPILPLSRIVNFSEFPPKFVKNLIFALISLF